MTPMDHLASSTRQDRSSAQQAPADPAKRVRGANVLSVDDFASHIATELGIENSELSSGARLIDDLGLDSLQMLELALLLDGMGAHFEAEDLARISRIGDVYRIYVERRTLSLYSDLACEGGPEPWPSAGSLRHRSTPPLSSRRTRQRPVVAADYAYLWDLARSDGDAVLGRERGRVVSPERFATALWQGVLAQHIILDAATAAPVGLLRAYDTDLRNGFAYLGLALERRVRGRGWPFEAMALFVNYLFRTWPLRKLYAELLAPSRQAIASGLGGLLAEEGRLVAHEYVDGAWVDLYIVGLFRERWEADSPRLLGRILGASVLTATQNGQAAC
jgi:RimJ/RimL family protein N-acetyltransferase/acyl carrier protein